MYNADEVLRRALSLPEEERLGIGLLLLRTLDADTRKRLLREHGFELTAEAEEELLKSIAQGQRGETLTLKQVIQQLKQIE